MEVEILLNEIVLSELRKIADLGHIQPEDPEIIIHLVKEHFYTFDHSHWHLGSYGDKLDLIMRYVEKLAV